MGQMFPIFQFSISIRFRLGCDLFGTRNVCDVALNVDFFNMILQASRVCGLEKFE